MEIGDNSKLPADFPKDIYVIDGKIVMAYSDQANESLSVSLDKSIKEVSSVYQEKLKTDGWNIASTSGLSNFAIIVAEKDNRFVSVVIGESNGKTNINITLTKK
ncbi:MAG: hypothetical protein ABH830_03545 [Patescibacteria group bacterium]